MRYSSGVRKRDFFALRGAFSSLSMFAVVQLWLTERYRDLSQKACIGHRLATAYVAHVIRINGAAKLTQGRIDFVMGKGSLA